MKLQISPRGTRGNAAR
uniref:Uncharacterized protein n=1 Tax=Arundo donax TaxID=35708 RepID=A0A0A9B002_ARUDO